jgi:hypothetical protein
LQPPSRRVAAGATHGCRYDEIILKSELPTSSPLKLRDFEFVERMGDCQRLPPCPSPASALATIMCRSRLDDEP